MSHAALGFGFKLVYESLWLERARDKFEDTSREFEDTSREYSQHKLEAKLKNLNHHDGRSSKEPGKDVFENLKFEILNVSMIIIKYLLFPKTQDQSCREF